MAEPIDLHFEVDETHLPLWERNDWRYALLMGGQGNGRSGTASRFTISQLFGEEYTRGAIMRATREDILLSPLLRTALSKPIPRWFYSGSTIMVRLNRKEIGDDDAKIIANILISQFKGQVAIEDFGFYARRHLAALIREERLMAGVYTLSELDTELRQRCLLMEKVGRGCTYEDAEVLAKYEGLRPDPTREDNPYNTFVREAMTA